MRERSSAPGGVCVLLQTGAQGALEVFGAGELHAELLDLSGGFPLVGADAFQEGFTLLGAEGGVGVEAIGGVQQVTHLVEGEAEGLHRFDYATDPDKVVIDLSSTHIWDASSVAALDAIETKYARRGKIVEIIGLNTPSAHLHGKLRGELTAGH